MVSPVFPNRSFVTSPSVQCRVSLSNPEVAHLSTIVNYVNDRDENSELVSFDRSHRSNLTWSKVSCCLHVFQSFLFHVFLYSWIGRSILPFFPSPLPFRVHRVSHLYLTSLHGSIHPPRCLHLYLRVHLSLRLSVDASNLFPPFFFLPVFASMWLCTVSTCFSPACFHHSSTRRNDIRSTRPLWFYYDSTMVPLWFHCDSTMVPLWFCYGSTRVTLWFHWGYTMVARWFHYGSTMAPLWFRFASISHNIESEWVSETVAAERES